MALGAALIAVLFAGASAAIPYEDAFITFRCARNLAEGGEYTYNLGENNFAGTSHLYTVLTALAFLLPGTLAVPAITLVNCTVTVIAVYWFSGLLLGDRRLRLIVWIAVALSPPAVEMAYSGMETATLVLLLAAASLRVSRRYDYLGSWTLVPMFLLPLVRPEAFAHAGLVWIASCSGRRRLDFGGGLSLVAGIGVLVSVNLMLFGTVWTQSMAAKNLVHAGHVDIGDFAQNLRMLFFERSVFAPINAWSLDFIKPLFAPPVVALLVWGLVRSKGERASWALVLGLAVVPTIGYALGGVLFDWYLAPGKIAVLCGAASALVLLADRTLADHPMRRAVLVGALFVSALGFLGQTTIGFLNGAIEAGTRIEAGRWIRDNTPSDAVMVLEPAGYIPFYAERRAWDEVGLASWQVIAARKRYGPAWLIPFLQQHRVDILVQRDLFAENRTTYHGYTLSEEERMWFDSNYRLAHAVTGDPGRAFSFAPLADLAARAKADRVPSIYIYVRRMEGDSVSWRQFKQPPVKVPARTGPAGPTTGSGLSLRTGPDSFFLNRGTRREYTFQPVFRGTTTEV